MKFIKFTAFLLFTQLYGCTTPSLQPIEQGDGNDFVASFSNAQQALYYERSDLNSTYSVVRVVRLEDGKPISLQLSGPPTYNFFSSPSIVETAGREYLYYIASAKYWGNNAQLMRAAVTNLHEAEPISLPSKYGAYSLMRAYKTSSGFAVVYRAGRSQLFFSKSADGLHFDKPVAVAIGTMPALAEFADGTLIMSYQNGASIDQMSGRLQFSIDAGTSWSKPVTLPHSGNVHDLYPVRRADGNLDIYYSVESPQARLALHRICVNSRQQFGVTETILDSATANSAKSALHSSGNGRLLSFSNQNAELTQTNLTLYPLESDAKTCSQ